MPTLNQDGLKAVPQPAAGQPQDMASPYYITTPSNKTEIVMSGNKGEMSFTVTNKTDAVLRTHFSLGRSDDGDAQGDVSFPDNSPLKKWLAIKSMPDPVPAIPPRGTVPVTVTVVVSAPGDSEGAFAFRLLAGAEPKPEEDFSASANITFKLTKGVAPPPPKVKWWMILLAVLGVLLIVGGILAAIFWPRGVPDVVGKPLSDAKQTLQKAGLQVKVNEVYSPGKPEGIVLDENPQAGAKPSDDKTEVLDVGSSLPAVPCVEGMQLTEALKRLSSAGLRGAQQPYPGPSSLASGAVVSQNPRVNVCTLNPTGLKVAPGSTVMLQVKP